MDIGVNCFTREFSDIFTLILTKIPWPWTCCPRCSVQGMMWSCRPRVELHGVLWCRQGSLVLLMIWAELSDEPQLCYYVNIIWNHNAIQMNKWIFLFWHRHNHLRSIILQSYHISIVFIFWFRWKSSHFDFFHSYCSLSLSLSFLFALFSVLYLFFIFFFMKCIPSWKFPVHQLKINMIVLKLKIVYMGVSKNNGTPKSSILIGFSIFNHPFWGTPIFGNTHITKVSPVSLSATG